MLRMLPVLLLFAAPLAAQDANATKPGHRVLAADRGTGKLAIVGRNGQVEWEFANRHDVHDLWMLANGNILTLTSPTTVVEITPQKQIVWKYESRPKPGYTGRVEVHAVQRLADGTTLIAESGNTRLIEVDPQGKITRTIALQVSKPNAHRDTRMVRKLKNGNYLVCQESDGCVKEYNAAGRVVWQYKLDLAGRPRSAGHGPEGHGVEVFGAVRLPNGHTLIAGGNNNRVIEVTPEGKIVWSVDQKELPGITLAWVTTLHVLPNGNIVIGNCHAGPTNPQLIEITREKKVVWTFHNQKLFGNNLAAAMILDTDCIR